MMKTLIIFIAITECFMLANSQCSFTKPQVDDETRVVAVTQNGQRQLLNEDKVATGTTLDFICSANAITPVLCQPNNQFSVTLPVANCPTPPKATVEITVDRTCSADAYRVGYKIGNEFLEVYRSCYKKDKVQALFASHVAQPYTLVTSRPEQKFTTDRIISSKDAATFDRRSVYERFKKLLGDKQTYISSPTDGVIDRGHLAPSGDYLYANNMAATFKYIDVVPQFSSINQNGNWKSIENWVRNYVRANGAAQIDTGAFDVLSLKDTNNNPVAMYLADSDRNPIPKWMYKIVKNTQDVAQYAFVTYNNIYDTQAPAAPCTTVTCPLQLKNTAQHGFTYCCNPQTSFPTL